MLNCAICKTHCCGMLTLKAPILMPYEEAAFPDEVKDTEPNGLHRLKSSFGHCIFFEAGKCAIYDRRPEECRAYPFIYQWEHGHLTVKLHDSCPQRMEAPSYTIPVAPKQVPISWWRKFMELSI